MIDNIAATLQHESNQRRIRSFIKQNDLLADAQIDDAAIIGQLPDVAIYHEFSSDTYKIRYKETREFLTEDEVSVWLKKIENPRPEISVQDSHKINSLNFNNPLNINGKNLISVDRLWEINESRKTDIMNKAIQRYYGIFDAGDDEFTKSIIEQVIGEYEAIQFVLKSSRIKVLDRSRKAHVENGEREKINKENGLLKSGKIKKSASQKQESTKFDITRDPLYSKYANDKGRILFFKTIKHPLNDMEAHARYEKSPMYLDSIS